MMKAYRGLIWLIPCLILISVAALGCFLANNNTSQGINSSSESGEAGISISTVNAIPLNKDIHSGVTADIFFGKGMSSRSILSEPYFSFLKDMNFQSLQYTGGSTSDHDHVIIGDTLVSGGRGDGYNIDAEAERRHGEDINVLLDGVGTVRFGKDFFNEYCALLKKLNIHGDITANVQNGTLEEVYWKIRRANAKRVIFGVEQNLGSNQKDFPNGNAYKGKVAPWIDSVEKRFPGIISVIDAAPVYRRSEKFIAWNSQISSMPGDEGRVYLWDKDLFDAGSDQVANLANINRAFTQTIPQWLESFNKAFPGKKAAVCQWGIKAKSTMHNKMIGCIYIGKFYKFMIDYNKGHGNLISYASFMSLKSLNRDGEISNFYYPLKACGMLFSGNKQVDEMQVTGIPGLGGIACDEKGKFTLLLINETGNEAVIPAIRIDGKPVEVKNFRVTTVSAPSLDSYSVKWDVHNTSSLRLKPYSVNVVEF